MVGKIGSGRSTLINNVIGEDYLHILKGFPTPPVIPEDVHRELLINNNKYQCNFITTPLDIDFYVYLRSDDEH